MNKLKKLKKPLMITAIVIGALILAAVVVGILNATVAGGSWNFGWSDYRYDESGYEVGSGTVPAQHITAIDVDWIDGNVQIVLCDDAYPSLTESAKTELTEDSLLRWSVSEDGKRLSVKYRKSSWFFGTSENKSKDLILRVPRRLMESLETLNVNTVSSNVTVADITVKQMNVKSRTGEIRINCKTSPEKLNVEGESGKIKITLPYETGFTMTYDSEKGTATVDFPYERENGRYVYRVDRAPTTEITVKSKKGDLILTYEN